MGRALSPYHPANVSSPFSRKTWAASAGFRALSPAVRKGLFQVQQAGTVSIGPVLVLHGRQRTRCADQPVSDIARRGIATVGVHEGGARRNVWCRHGRATPGSVVGLVEMGRLQGRDG